MKKLMFAFFPWLFIAFGYKAMAQDDMIKKREEIERIEDDCRQERARLSKLENDHSRKLDDLRDKNKRDLESIETSQKVTINLLVQEKEKTVDAHQEAIARERLKMEVHH